MSKTFMERLRDAANNTGNYEDYPEYGELGERLIAIDDLLKTELDMVYSSHYINGINIVREEIRQIIDG
jgi:hypothetical protein